ncbi:MAG: hypothetical protein ACAH95_09115 [Fimbriimonas sp.]
MQDALQPESRVFKPSLWTWLSFGALELAFGALAVAACFVARENVGLALMSGTLFLGMFILGIFVGVRLLATTEISGNGVSRRFLSWSESFRWEDVVGLDVASRASEGYELRLSTDKRIWIPFRETSHGKLLRRMIDEYRPLMNLERSELVIGTFESAPIGIVFGVFLLFLAVVAGFTSPREALVAVPALAGIGVLFLWLAIRSRRYRVVVDSSGVSASGWSRDKRVLFHDLHTIRLYIYTFKSSSYEAMELQYRGGQLHLMKTFSNYAAVRDAVLARCPEARVLDERPPSDR